MNIDDLIAIDIHTHAEEPCSHGERDDGYYEFQQGMAKYFGNPAGAEGMLPSPRQTAQYFRERKIGAVIFPVDSESNTGFYRYSNEEVAEICAENDDILIPFASIDPWKGKMAAREARRLIRDFGVRGFKFHPTIQAFWPNDRMAYPFYEVLEEEGAITLFHTGQTGVGSGMHGGMGMRLKYSHPMCIDDVAVDFPDLRIIMAHPSFPWQEEALAVAQHKPNVYIDLSGWSPKYFPEILVKYANSLLKKKMLFGSDWPAITPDRWLADFEKAPFKDEVRPLILKENAKRLLNL
ncbi:MAG: amidohydrolase family protein [Maritimibacter harenae]|jgi:predicted TIM-barrel fold metal-dependent hydrolase|uniref:Amidohydrolase family protein n=1 Tax=Maritimibacter harenae TaxID=2606218 RepID=A0A845M3F4_9RHOB|nr:amidohydrolase family protein [Maritimibacter harenae]MZR12033.1 amidohydrolase family protein [Maritimibacter harenae]